MPDFPPLPAMLLYLLNMNSPPIKNLSSYLSECPHSSQSIYFIYMTAIAPIFECYKKEKNGWRKRKLNSSRTYLFWVLWVKNILNIICDDLCKIITSQLCFNGCSSLFFRILINNQNGWTYQAWEILFSILLQESTTEEYFSGRAEDILDDFSTFGVDSNPSSSLGKNGNESFR